MPTLTANDTFQIEYDDQTQQFQTLLADGAGWRAASLPSLPVYGLSSAPNPDLTWHTTLRSQAGGVWLETALTVQQPTTFNPSMILWLGTLDNLDDRQAHTWRNTILRAPTINQQGMGGNDLPAGYFYDHARHTETIVYVDASAFAWSAHRFYTLEVREVYQYAPVARFGFGLVATAPDTAQPIAAGEYVVRWWITQRVRTVIPTPWAAQQQLIAAIAPLLDPQPTLNTDAPGWQQMALNALHDLADTACWTTVGQHTGLRAYVRGSSQVGRDEAVGFELMTQLDVLWPLLLWRQGTQQAQADPLIERLLATLPLFDRPLESFVTNNYPPRAGDTFMDTWYFLENALIKLPWVAYLTQDSRLLGMFFQALKGAQQLAANTHDLFPLFADASDWQARQSVLNVGVSGLYAAGCVLAAQLQPEEAGRYLDEAARTLHTTHALPPHMHTHEPQQLTFAAAAARYLATHRADNTDWPTYRSDYVNLSLRMGYWERDSRVDFYDTRGMFQACASLAYPAFKENVETLVAWPELLREGGAGLPVALMAAFANLQRCHNYAFFDPWLPAAHRTPYSTYIPHENIATHELNRTATFGKELYGTGEVFWSALLFDALGHTDDRDILCLSLEVPCLTLSRIPDRPTRFLLYNPADSERTTTLRTAEAAQSFTLAPHSYRFIVMES